MSARGNWSDEALKFVRDQYHVLSPSTIASILCNGLKPGTTRNGVIGKAQRMGLARPYSEHRHQQALATRRAHKLTNPSKRYVEKKPPPAPIAPLLEPTGNIVTLLELSDFHCKEVVGLNDSNVPLYCGTQRTTTNSFCPYHAAINCYPIVKRDRQQRPFYR